MVRERELEASREIQRRTGRTFHLATRVLPEWARHPTYVLYAFFRVADEVVDDPDPGPPAEQRAELERIREAALGERDADDPVLRAFRELRERHGIPASEVEEFVDAMAMDVETARYDTYGDLEAYLRGSSVAVAYMMLAVMDPPEKETARPHAKALGEAFQLTNFLRDVREDVVDYDRIYLPRETLDRHGVTEERIEALEFDEDVAAAMEEELARTEQLYREGVAGIGYLPEDCRLAVLAAATLYAEHHRLLRRRGLDVLSERPSLSTPRRLWVLARTWLHYRLTGDPEEAFYRVAPVARDPEGTPAGRDSEDAPAGRDSEDATAGRDSEDATAGRDGVVVADGEGRIGRVTGATRSLAGTIGSWLPRWS